MAEKKASNSQKTTKRRVKSKGSGVSHVRRFERDKENSFIGRYKYHIAILAIIIVAIAGVYFSGLSIPGSVAVESGDKVTVAYKAMYENGTVFDEGNFTFIAGYGQVIKGFDEAVIGMHPGESKKVTVPPEKAYGNYDENRVIPFPITREISRVANSTVDDFIKFFNETPVAGKTYSAQTMAWPIKVIEVKNNTVIFSHEPEDGMEVNQSYGIERVTKDENKVYITLQPKIGALIQTLFGIAKLTKTNGTHIFLDFNHPLAGKTIVFEIKLLDIKKQEKPAGNQSSSR